MFSQAKDAAGRSEGGLGIGLALVKGLVELHGGRAEARSGGAGRGSEFIVRLPLSAARDAPPHARPAGRVLVADDNADAAESIALLLELAGHEVRVAHTGHGALAVAREFRPDAALLDIGMPELSGYEVARELRREPWGAAINLIALRGWGREEDRLRALEAGFDRHLTKPIDPQALTALLSREEPF
jgi:CheY-like chemotaxis protein